ncbi:hypothetical protein THASP1DRAFT_35133 [Thamnocephalis sphaerospora]|uniref:HECT-type E3 ubiquitin transferase n=1 Tax=Thamnocephalis sphaerospora TaxID=78915 RepID=A0A4P9XL43_9FUNG|nr:hypothetical protein THASP1DRAFT_35133 [Thamnocephalis sphaerospora]|eukprot:RKP06502.1 hypothetical protein THASP1DRAFT_35133 [Thamnocephalis sphaerospora]
MDWPTAAGARVMALFFSANKQRSRVELHEFYNTLADYIDLQRDFDLWRRTAKRFCFCQYPFLLSIGARMRIMEVEAQRQMQQLADTAMYNTLRGYQPTVPYLVLRVRREFLIEDSLNQLAQLRRDFKKKLRIEFVGEMGIDAGGLTKEWFLLLVRDLFSPDYGMFTCDEDSGMIWFNPASFESSDQYYLVGVIIGLAIYNSTILDIRLPLACYKKLMGAPVGLSDLAKFRPTLVDGFAHGLRQLLEYKGDDVEDVFGLDFVAQYEAFGEIQLRPLVPDGENKPVTRKNRREYVDRYVSFLLNTSMNDQFVAFKRGFDEVCDGATIKLFRPEEIELVVRGSADSLQLIELRAVTVYDGFYPDERIIQDFWDIFMAADPAMQRRILFFITGSDRVPATGMSNMVFKITCIGEDCERFPQSHTCFNQLCLYRYRTRNKLYDKLITAVMESEGFGLK